jgi:spore germination protein KB
MNAKQAICMLTIFTLGSTLLYSGGEINQDLWLSVLIGASLFVPVLLVYARLISLYPGKNIYEIISTLLGKFFGKVIVILYVLYAIFFGAGLMRYFSEFMQVSSLLETPQIVIFLLLFVIALWTMKCGMQTLGRWSKFVLPVVVISISITIIIAVKYMHFDNILPIAATPFPSLMNNAFSFFALPFADTVLFLTVFDSVDENETPYKILFFGLLISTVIILAVKLRNLFILDVPSLRMYYFTSFTAVSVIALGDFLTRIEVLIGLVFSIDLYVRFCVAYYAVSAGLSNIFKIDYKKLAVPAGLLIISLAAILFENMLEMYLWNDVYKYFAFPFQVALPLLMFIVAEIKARRKKKELAENMASE